MFKDKKMLYELSTGLLALVSAFIVSVQLLSIDISQDVLNGMICIDDVIYIIFVIDYVMRLCLSENKVNFFKGNLIDLISIIPFNAMFKVLRILKLTRLLRLTKLLKISILYARFKDDTKLFLQTNNFQYVLLMTIVLIFVGAIAISYVENLSVMDGIWLSFVTVSSTGFGDLVFSSDLGKIIGILLMVLGVGFVGMLSGTVATYFLMPKKDKNTYKYKTIENIKNKLDTFDSLTIEDLEDMYIVLKAFKEADNKK